MSRPDPNQERALAIFHLRAAAADLHKRGMSEARDLVRERADAIEATRWDQVE
jgi:hypothetical protein